MYSTKRKRLECVIANKRDSGKISKKYTEHKCDSTCFEGGSTTAKGITKTAQKHMPHEEYRRVLYERTSNMVTNRCFRTMDHRVYTVLIRKRGLPAYYDKKYILDDGISTLSYGHYRIE